ncbi:MAG: lysoplasmalogenase [Alphaproteobacteria bacterium]|jgi:uncharacterized membrane protein YhhN|nr:lysoplasmalogenase [Alphaproteobacteria bacterium]MBT4082416.1 lysoplasmalogenase [Alphaproteobacteria bacterium]MBT4545958.1 lysoplasmalogenase [Alphaproteobacteria bacterium]MBT7743858.1 lysoplasmalogenase [Alphaproteobacteria bacterium]
MSSTDIDTTSGYSTSNRLLLGLSAGFALSYLLCLPLDPFAGLVFIKGGGVFLLAVVAWRVADDTAGRLLSLALLLSSLGDVFLRIDPVGMFVHGLGSFLVAHLVYVMLFLRLRPRPVMASGRQRALIALFIIYGLGLGGWMMPHLGAHMIPVLVYAFVICLMGITCVVAGFGNSWVLLGALLFISSDTALAVDKFMTPIDGIGWYIWPSYYIGQLLIMTGVILELRNRREGSSAV